MRRLSAASKILLTVGLSFGIGACVTAESDPAPSVGAERGPLGKADAPGSCLDDDGGDHCGGPSNGACWCDDLCAQFGDCCGDKQPVCDDVDVGPTLCLSDDVCGDGEFCDHTQCLSNCPDGLICPAVCWGACEEAPQPPQCPDVCEAICAGEPEPELPVGCPLPGCACDPEPEPEPESCADACGGKSEGACWCDDQCTGFGDCCEDYEAECAEPVDVCEQITADYFAETAEIRSCTADAECGQVLTGTSCGCTNNWVARTDADITEWQALQSLANEEGCPIGGISTCDCPSADGFACNDGTCTWNYN